MTDSAVKADSSLESLVGKVADEFLRRQEQDERPDVEEYALRYPEAAEILRKVLTALRLLELSAPGGPASAGEGFEGPGCTLGDYRIIREIGRGGMGIVYEAQQISLKRRVALKVLPFAAVLDPRQLQRFQNEAQAAACLHHTNIVPVFGVGNERGVHYYAMQFIEGQTLAQVIADLRLQIADLQGKPDGSASAIRGYTSDRDAQICNPQSTIYNSTAVALTTERSITSREFFHNVARLGIQAAEALDHAHQQGILHRDIKPANLLLDVCGILWITDFGLARLQNETQLSMTGDLIGTLRYMSPEQALAKRVIVDHRTDIYSLGVTLYELLTLQPPFTGDDRQELLRQIAFEEPRPPRRLNKSIPVELATIVSKALEKNAQDRYGTAQEMADDLGRFLADQPIKARQPSWRQVAKRWSRRHKPLVGATLAVLVMAAVFGGSAGLWRFQQRVAADAEAKVALDDAGRLQKEGKLPEALWAIRRAEPLRNAGLLSAGLGQRVRARQTDLEMLDKLDGIRLQVAALKEGRFDEAGADPAYDVAFQAYGIDVLGLGPAEAVERIKASGIRVELTTALDHWAVVRRTTRPKEDTTWKELLTIARAADPDDWRNRLRDALGREDTKAIKDLGASDNAAALPAATALMLAAALWQSDAREAAVVLLRRAQREHPGDFFINSTLSLLLAETQQWEESLRFCMAALALRPLGPAAHTTLGSVLREQGRLAEAAAEFHKAIDFDPNFALPHNNLGTVWWDQGRLEEAEAEYRKAIDLDPRLAPPHLGVGNVRAHQGRLADAEAEFRKAINLNPRLAPPHNSLGNVRETQGRLAEAEAEFHKAIDLDPKYASPHQGLGNVRRAQGRLEEAVAEYHKAIHLNPRLAMAHNNLGAVRGAQDRLEEAVAEFHKAIDLDPKIAQPHNNMGAVRKDQGRLEEAVAEYRKAVELGWKQAAPMLRACERQLAFRQRLSGLLTGQDRPANQIERLGFAELCQQPFERRNALAARLYAEAFAADPKLADDLGSVHRYNAACAAALAGCGRGQDAAGLDEPERARLRRLALDWLRADLAAWQKALDKEPDKARAAVGQQMKHWLTDGDFASVRGREALGRLPEAERGDWQKLWEEVEALRQRSAKPAVPASPARP